jgi:hypothetical protein
VTLVQRRPAQQLGVGAERPDLPAQQTSGLEELVADCLGRKPPFFGRLSALCAIKKTIYYGKV